MQRKAGTQLLSAITLAALTPVLVYGQATEGTILGSVQDRSGGGVPNATVIVSNENTGAKRQTSTNPLGEYLVTNLPLGSYSVSVEASGFKKALRAGIGMTVKARIRVDLTLEIGEVNQSVEVSGQAPLLKTDTPELGGVLTRENLQEIPVFGRNYLALSALVPGTTRGPKADRRRDFAGEAVTVAGLSSEANNFIIDGISNNNEFNGGMGVAPAIDGLQEFAIQTSQYSAEFGRAGGGVVNIAIKSGTNQYHGFAYDYLRNNKLDARPYDFTGTNPASAPIRRNQFGAGLGGPIRPNKFFLFGNYEGIRFPNNGITSNIVPTAAQKKGDFTSTPAVVYADPATTRIDPANPSREIRTPFPGNIIPANRQSPIGVKLLSAFPDPNYRDPNPNVRNNYLVTESNVDTLNSFNIKTDVNLRRSDTLAAHITDQRASRARSSWMPKSLIGATAQINGINSGINETHVISPTTVNEFRFGYNYTNSGNAVLVPVNTLSEFNIPGLANFPAAAAYPDLRVRNMTRTRVTRPIASVGTPFLIVEHSFQWLDTLSKQMGSHALKMGAEVTRIRSERLQGFPGNAQISTSAAYTTPVVGQSLEALRDGTADMLMDALSDYQTVYVLDATRLRGTRASWFVQDDWRATKKLSLSIGLRHDIFTPFGELRNRMTNFDLAGGVMTLPESTRSIVGSALGLPNGNLPPTFRYTGLGQVVPKTQYTNFGPRIGFAYAATSKFVLRGGYGIFYGVTVGNNASNAGTNAPFYTQVSAGTAELDKPLLMSAGFPSGGIFNTLSSNGIAPYYQPVDRHDPYTQKWSLNLQWSPMQRVVFEAGYTGQRALAFPALTRLNFPTPGPGNIQARRPYPTLAGSTAYLPINDSNYNGLELSAKLLHFRGLTLQSAFSFSKVLGYQDGIDGGILTDPNNFRYDYGPQNFDFRKRWVIGYIYRLPSARSLPAVARYALGGWETSGLVTLQGGPPFSVLVSGQVLNNGLDGNNRATVLSNPNLSTDQRTRQRWFDTSAFAAPPTYAWGSQGKNTLSGPGSAVVDFAMQKSVPVREGMRFTIRMEANNFFNRVNLGLPAATLNAANFGAIRTIDSGPRLIQLVGRFDF